MFQLTQVDWTNVHRTYFYSKSRAHRSSVVIRDCGMWSSCWRPSRWHYVDRSTRSVTHRSVFSSHVLYSLSRTRGAKYTQ